MTYLTQNVPKDLRKLVFFSIRTLRHRPCREHIGARRQAQGSAFGTVRNISYSSAGMENICRGPYSKISRVEARSNSSVIL